MECIKLQQIYYENKPLVEINYLWQKYNAQDNLWRTIDEDDDYFKLLGDFNYNYKGWFKDGDDVQRQTYQNG